MWCVDGGVTLSLSAIYVSMIGDSLAMIVAIVLPGALVPKSLMAGFFFPTFALPSVFARPDIFQCKV